MIILGIETSCDETAAAIVQDGTKILSNVVASSIKMHVKTGGIIPEIAARQQVKSIIPVINQALSQAFSKTPSTNYLLLATKIDAIAVTVGPGLIGSLLVGVETAKTLSYLWKKPIIPVNHLVAHIYANWLVSNPKSEILNDKQISISRFQNQKTKDQKLKTKDSSPEFPAIALVVSGGHTDLVLMQDHPSASHSTLRTELSGSDSKSSGHAVKIDWLGGTRDDAAGEAFDKTARLLGLPYPGGPAISAVAEKFQIPRLADGRVNSKFQMNLFPRPIINEDNFDFSFSGLKTAVMKEVEKAKANQQFDNRTIIHLAAEVQEAIVDVLVTKTLEAVKHFKPKSLLLAGGVSANTRLRESFLKNLECKKLNVPFFVPLSNLCTDNAAYVASYAFYNFNPIPWNKILANPQLTIKD